MNDVAELKEQMSSIMSELAEMRHEMKSFLMKIYDGSKVIILLCLGIFLVCLVMVAVFK